MNSLKVYPPMQPALPNEWSTVWTDEEKKERMMKFMETHHEEIVDIWTCDGILQKDVASQLLKEMRREDWERQPYKIGLKAAAQYSPAWSAWMHWLADQSQDDKNELTWIAAGEKRQVKCQERQAWNQQWTQTAPTKKEKIKAWILSDHEWMIRQKISELNQRWINELHFEKFNAPLQIQPMKMK